MKLRHCAAVLLGVAVTAASAGAGQTVHTVSVTSQNTNWGATFNPINVPQHDPALGQLQSVMICFRGRVTRQFKVESLDNESSTVTLTDLSSAFIFRQPCDPATIMTARRTYYPDLTYNLTSFDGGLDFGGSSGRDTGLVHRGMKPVEVVLTGADAVCFIGTGMINIPVDLRFTSTIAGPGNLAAETVARATVTGIVVYNYR